MELVRGTAGDNDKETMLLLIDSIIESHQNVKKTLECHRKCAFFLEGGVQADLGRQSGNLLPFLAPRL